MATKKTAASPGTSSSTRSASSNGGTRARKRASASAGSTRSTTRSAPRASAPTRRGASAAAAAAARQLLDLTGREPEGVTGLEADDDGWNVQVEVLEVRRIPETTDVLALYEVQVDFDGELQGYRRLRRYTRGASGEE
ncbi:MAG: gas vesicle protein GvpO [Nocardioidaceae bacterium]